MSGGMSSQERHDMEKWSKEAWEDLRKAPVRNMIVHWPRMHGKSLIRCYCQIADSQYLIDDNGRCYFCGRPITEEAD